MPSIHQASRVYFFLPVGTVAERLAASSVSDLIQRSFGGYTCTLFQPSVVHGYWMDGDTLYIDEIALLFTDVLQSALTRAQLNSELDRLKALAFEAYQQSRSPQLEMWVTVEPIDVLIE
jgi:hypothetical protein